VRLKRSENYKDITNKENNMYIIENRQLPLVKTAETKERAEQIRKQLEAVFNAAFGIREVNDIWSTNHGH
jgi:hypothetical protein